MEELNRVLWIFINKLVVIMPDVYRHKMNSLEQNITERIKEKAGKSHIKRFGLILFLMQFPVIFSGHKYIVFLRLVNGVCL